MTTIADEIAAKEAELEQARAALQAAFDYRPGGSLKTKTFGIRSNAALRRGAQAGDTVQRLEREIAALHRKAAESEPQPLDLDRLPHAQYIRTRNGWYAVVKVNRKTVKVAVDPGWDDLIPIGRIIEIRERSAA